MPTDTPTPTAPEEGRVFPCQQCGASLRFAPTVGRLACPNCGTVNDLPTVHPAARASAFEELDYEAHLRRQAGNEPVISRQLVECPQCGAQTQFDDHVVASVCAFCATPLVAASAQATRQIQPRGVVPFALEPKGAQQLFRQWIQGRWFAPNALKALVQSAQGVRGVYLPCWTFDAQTHSSYSGMRGVDRTVQETRRDNEGREVTVSRTITDWYPASGHVSLAFDDTLVSASRSIPEHLAKVLHGWKIDGMHPYSDDFIAGFTVEAYQLGLEPAFGEARTIFANAIESAVRADIGGNHQRVDAVSTSYEAVTFKHILLPTWIASYNYGGKVFRVVVNGQTGEVVGDRPWSPWKIGFAVLAAVVVIGTIYLASR